MSVYFVKMVVEPLIEHYANRDYTRIATILQSRLILWRDQFKKAVPSGERIFSSLDVRSMGISQPESAAAPSRFSGGSLASRTQSSLNRAGISTYEQLITTIGSVGGLLRLRGFGLGGLRMLYPELQSKFPNHPLTLEIQDFLSKKGNQPPSLEKQRRIQLERMYLLELQDLQERAKLDGTFRQVSQALKGQFNEKIAAQMVFHDLGDRVSTLIGKKFFYEAEERIAQLRYVEMMTVPEIVRRTGMSQTEIIKILAHLRTKLLDLLEQSPPSYE